MRHLIALLTLAFALVACDESTTAPVDTIPGPPNAPRLKVTVLTGTKAAPVDSPTVKVEWEYKDSVQVVFAINDGYAIIQNMRGIGDTTVKVSCAGNELSKFIVVARSSTIDNGIWAMDSSKAVYCNQGAK